MEDFNAVIRGPQVIVGSDIQHFLNLQCLHNSVMEENHSH